MSRILIVDDDPDFVEMTRIVLEQQGYEIDSASNGGEALQAIRADKPDLVVLDVIMSSILDGLSVTQELQDDPEHRDIPILMVTSIANTDYAALFPTDEYVHISAFMTKPIAPDELLSQVKRLLS
ncbi:MAG: PleD family two-component system response regulator [Anaerolineae bacterium]|jgi:CheY-like chemotaxis protein